MPYQRIERLQAQGKTIIFAGLNFAEKAYKSFKSDLEKNYPQPIWQLTVNGVDISHGVANRLMSLTLNDNRGLEADTLEVELSDHDNKLTIPPKGAVIELSLGYHTTGLVYKGAYIVNEITHQGTPDTLSIIAMSADLKDTLKAKKERSFDQTTLGKIIEKIAIEHKLTAKIHSELANKAIYHLDQNESDINLLTRLADEFDATASIKDDHLLFTPIGKHTTVNGQDLPHLLITRELGDNHSYSETADIVSGVRTYFYDTTKKDKVQILAGNEDENVKEIRYVHRDEKSATDTAIAVYRKAQRAVAHLSYKLALGQPELIPEMPVMVYGIKDSIDQMDWTLTNIKHTLDDNGYTTSIELERTLGEPSEITPPIRVGEPKDKKKEQRNEKSKAEPSKNKTDKSKENTQPKRSQKGKRYRQSKQQKNKALSDKNRKKDHLNNN